VCDTNRQRTIALVKGHDIDHGIIDRLAFDYVLFF